MLLQGMDTCRMGKKTRQKQRNTRQSLDLVMIDSDDLIISMENMRPNGQSSVWSEQESCQPDSDGEALLHQNTTGWEPEDVFGTGLDCGSIVDMFDEQDFCMMVHDMEMGHILTDDVYPYTSIGAVLEQGEHKGKNEQSEMDWRSCNVDQLRRELKRRGLSTLGRKHVLVKRLDDHGGDVVLDVMQKKDDEPKCGKVLDIKVETCVDLVDDDDPEEVQEEEEDVSDSWSPQTISDLRRKLREAGLATKGKKNTLVKRLRKFHLEREKNEKTRSAKKSARHVGRQGNNNTKRNRSPSPPASGFGQGYATRSASKRKRNDTSRAKKTSGRETRKGTTTRHPPRKREVMFGTEGCHKFPLKTLKSYCGPICRNKENSYTAASFSGKATHIHSEKSPPSQIQPFRKLSVLEEPKHLFSTSVYGVDIFLYPSMDETYRVILMPESYHHKA